MEPLYFSSHQINSKTIDYGGGTCTPRFIRNDAIHLAVGIGPL